eukprot:gnl/Trimastix_PCT/2417.p1 GENE.gnl/Trimastix_PCT/2417~~gnl/Trimastix_PCT/2417.p1  ORF type:complete len:349 (-),score=35.97 gnl/Trimastix_PCT/2417:185-1111(-)
MQLTRSIEVIPRLAIKARSILRGHSSKIISLQWCEDKRHLVSASQDGRMIVWNAMTSLKEHLLKLRCSWVMCCAYSPNGNLVASGGLDNSVSIYNLKRASMDPCQDLGGHQGYVSSCQFVGDHRILSASGDMTTNLWDVPTGTCLHTFRGHRADVMSVSVADDRNTFVTGACDATARMYDMRSEKCVHTYTGHKLDINAVQHFPTGYAFGTGSDDASCRLFDIRAQRCLMQYTHDRILWSITSVAFSASGRLLFGGYDDYNCYVWDVLKGRQVAILAGHDNCVSCLGITGDGMALCTGSWDSVLKIWA